ncbi:uroporphyrinogen-III synthase [Thauera humireducens]|uniref:uroporphyrinogen-III synthase n=1 Tax=Thauera humireducens TaxID=1134435 RepID=UPI00311FC758
MRYTMRSSSSLHVGPGLPACAWRRWARASGCCWNAAFATRWCRRTDSTANRCWPCPSFPPGRSVACKVLIFRGDGGRDLIRDTLRERGARGICHLLPARYCPKLDPAILLQPAAHGKLDGLLLTSSEGVRNLCSMFGAGDLRVLQAVPVFASHARIAAEAREAGFAVVIETPAGDEGLLQALTRHFG